MFGWLLSWFFFVLVLVVVLVLERGVSSKVYE